MIGFMILVSYNAGLQWQEFGRYTNKAAATEVLDEVTEEFTEGDFILVEVLREEKL